MVRPVPVVRGKAPQAMKGADDYFDIVELAAGKDDPASARPPSAASSASTPEHRPCPSAALLLSASLQRPCPRHPARPGEQRADHHPRHAGRAQLRAWRAVHAGRLRALRHHGPDRLASWSAWPAGSWSMLLVGVVLERGLIRRFYDRPHEDQILVTFGVGIVDRRRRSGRCSAPTACTCRRRPGAKASPSIGFLFYPIYRLRAHRHRRGAARGALSDPLRHLDRPHRAGGDRGCGHGRHPRHQRAPRLPAGVRDRRGGGRAVGHAVRADRLGAAGHGRRISWWNPSW